ncbi:MAG TPA: hypothetical protein VG711_02515, partial [Phycisphaerales bacterium]|nr:hypothetical protein [Phycisphaerales bacterium]
RSLTVGPQTRIMKYRPERPMHERYDTVENFLTSAQNTEITQISQLVNTFFRWEFNSCESILKDGVISPIDYANACPDVAIISLHVHFPWAMLSLLKWSLFCATTGRKMAIDLEQRRFFTVGDRTDLNYTQKLTEYQKLTDEYFEVSRFNEFCAKNLSHLDEVAFEYFTSSDFDTHLIRSVAETFRPHEHDYFISAYRHMFSQWAAAHSAAATV